MSENHRGDFLTHTVVSDMTSLPTEQQEYGMIYQLTVGPTNFSSLNSFKCSLVSLRHF